MRLDPETRLGSVALTLVIGLMDLLIRGLSRTWRFRVIEGEEVLDRVIRRREPVVFCFWHNRILPAAGLLVRRVAPAGMDLTLMASASRDGELSSGFVRRHGARVVRGSSSRGGTHALRSVLRLIRNHGTSPILIPDGPKGPAYEFKTGVLGLSQMSGAPIFLMGFAASSSWTVGTWDRMVFPRPFARVAVAVEPPRSVPRGLPEEELERERQACETRLAELTRQAEAAVGARDPLADAGAGPHRRDPTAGTMAGDE